jgi:glycosyltransferase involved in cell wall biosynthesis
MGTSPQRLDVLFITHNFPRHHGDFAGRFLERLADMLRTRGVHVGVVAPHDPGALEFEVMSGIPVWRFRYADDSREILAYRGQAVSPSLFGPRGLWAYRSFFSEFRKLAGKVASETSPRVIHAHWWVPGGWVARGIARDTRFVVTSHGTDVRLLERKAWMRPLARQVYGQADIVTTVSRSMAEAIMSSVPAVKDRLHVAPMPTDDAMFVGTVREQLNSPPKILCVTRHTVQKRNAVLIRALATLRDSGFQFRCRIVGDGGSERESTLLLINQLALGGSVVLVPSMVQTELIKEYRDADVTVLPAVDEGFGLALVEAQLCGCPVVGARSGGIIDIITDGQSGLLANPDDPDDLARVLRMVLTDPQLRVRLAREGQRSAQTHFSSKAIVDKFLEWYQLG